MQLSLTICAAEGAVEFEHRSRIQKCVYVRKPSLKETCLFRLRTRTYSTPTFGIVVRLKCGTATRCKKGTKVLFSPLMDTCRGNLNDDEREALRMINTLIGQDVTDFHPRTNLAWLFKLTEKTISKNEGYIIGKPSGRESLETLDLWMEHLLLSDSVADSIDSLFDATLSKKLVTWIERSIGQACANVCYGITKFYVLGVHICSCVTCITR